MPSNEFNDSDENHKTPPGQASEWASAKRVLAQQSPPRHVEAALLRAFERHHAPRPWYRRLTAPALVSGGSLAGASGIAALVVAGLFPSPTIYPEPPAMATMDLMEQGFLPLVDAQQMKMAARAQLLHAELPRHVLASLGVPLDEDIPDELVRAELMVTDSGEPIAIRVAFN